MRETLQMRTWAEIDLDALAHNYHLLRGLTGRESAKPPCRTCSRFLGVVKADAYGHGAVPVAKKLERLGADMLAVACLDEAAELRQAGIALPVLCLGRTPPRLAPLLLEYGVTQTVEDLAAGEILSAAAVRAGGKLNIHVKLDTGMGRLGFVYGDGDNTAVLREIQALCALPGLEAEGLFTHFSDADGSQEYTALQSDRFQDAVNELHELGADFEIYHCGASAAVLNYPWTHMGMIRPGIALYGCLPDPSVPDPGLRPVLTLKSRVAAVRALPAGSYVSYGRTARLERDSRLAVLPAGYGDGYSRKFSNAMEVLIRGRRCPVVGRVCMDMCMADVTDVPGVQEGDTAVLYGQDGLLEQAARLADTIPYELLCAISPRIPRLYLENGQQVSV
ncbi:MAG: alanine racemase [Lawsonibacter sp.]|nr:alanine racemase [Lawsonibacter sp.]